MYKLMIVDDELLMRVGIRSMIEWEEYGFQIVGEAGNGKDGLDIAIATSPDLIITDIKMPVMDGLQFIRETSNELKNCKYVILSNFDEFHYVKEALRLGATDYLIKSEITPASLSELLISVREKLQAEFENKDRLNKMPYDYSLSLSHLKENFFKDLISGFINEKDANTKANELHIRVKSSELVVLILKLNHFETLKKKYVEKDEKLLRFSILNILEEVIPSKWDKEIVIGNSSEYLVIVNTLPESTSVRTEIERLCSKMLASLKDFMNLTLSVGASTLVPGFKHLKTAYKEATQALSYHFFTDNRNVLFYEDIAKEPVREAVESLITLEEEQEFVTMWSSKDENQSGEFLAGFRSKLEGLRADEHSIRMKYIWLMEKINTQLTRPGKGEGFSFVGHSFYETALNGDNWVGIHQSMLEYIAYCFDVDSRFMRESTYSELAVDIINKYYAEDISLQSVANQINVNPSYLSRIFKQEKGENFISYLTQVRIDKAKVYLKGGKLKVYEIADKVGYHNYTYFSKIFKKNVGVTPEEYRG
ncbi:response regulator [Paenibacillus albidus]|uniref:response regulator n=1 Tax=Paenibacillus albidus TaxID=2041023 RepID=UPI001BE7ACE3|nr:response regulator [Paenibacillus albidus]MBT2293213.1 response regulator [Paenibacillus albidus]